MTEAEKTTNEIKNATHSNILLLSIFSGSSFATNPCASAELIVCGFALSSSAVTRDNVLSESMALCPIAAELRDKAMPNPTSERTNIQICFFSIILSHRHPALCRLKIQEFGIYGKGVKITAISQYQHKDKQSGPDRQTNLSHSS